MARCWFCRGSGHNRKTCPSLKETIDSRLAANPSDWWALQQKERNKPITKENMTCSYCRNKGHNKASCDTKKSDVRLLIEENNKIMIAVSNYLKKHPEQIGLGDLYISTDNEGKTTPYIVSGILQERENVRYIDSFFQVYIVLKPLVPNNRGNYAEKYINFMKYIREPNGQHSYYEKICKTSSSGKVVDVPSTLLEHLSYEKLWKMDVFNEKRGRSSSLEAYLNANISSEIEKISNK